MTLKQLSKKARTELSINNWLVNEVEPNVASVLQQVLSDGLTPGLESHTHKQQPMKTTCVVMVFSDNLLFPLIFH